MEILPGVAYLEESVERVLGGAIDFDLAEEGDGIRNEIVSGTNVTNAVVNLLSRRPRLLLFNPQQKR